MVSSISALESCEMIRVLVADSTPMGCQLLGDALKRCRHFDVVGSAPTSSELLAAATKSNPQVTLISANLDDEPAKGFQVARQLLCARPGIKVVILLDSSRRDLGLEAFRAGAKGVFCRANSIKSLYKCIYSVHRGQIWANSDDV